MMAAKRRITEAFKDIDKDEREAELHCSIEMLSPLKKSNAMLTTTMVGQSTGRQA